MFTEIVSNRVGKLFGLGFDGLSVPAWLRKFTEQWGLGAVILFDKHLSGKKRNIISKKQLIELCEDIASLPSKPLVLIDQEGGEVCRLREELGFTHLPSAKQMASLPLTEQQKLLDESYQEMAEFGIGMNLAPVIDCELRPDAPIVRRGRAYHAETEEVAGYALRHAKAASRWGVGLCLKHYPGLGAATTDTHQGGCLLSNSLATEPLGLFAELVPKIPGGAVLLSHAIAPQWGKLPVSLNPTAIEALLTVAPKAWLISDDLQMQAIQQYCSTEIACQKAIKAGCHLLLICNSLLQQEEECERYIQSLLTAVEKDTLLAEACYRAILRT